MHTAVLLQAQVANLQKANEASSRRKKRQKKRIQKQGVLTIAEGSEIIDQNGVDQQIEREIQQSGTRSSGTALKQRRCGRCREVGHDIRKCPLG